MNFGRDINDFYSPNENGRTFIQKTIPKTTPKNQVSVHPQSYRCMNGLETGLEKKRPRSEPEGKRVKNINRENLTVQI